MSASTRDPRVSEPTPAPGGAFEVGAAWSLPRSGLSQWIELGDRVAVAFDGHYAVVGRKDGKVSTTRELEGCVAPFAERPALLLAACGKARDELVALDPRTLEPRWRVRLGAQVRQVSARRDTVFAVVDGNLLAAVDLGGQSRWRVSIPSQRTVLLEEDGERVYAYEADPTVWAYDRATGALAWTREEKERIGSLTALAGGSLALGVESGLVELDPKSGKAVRPLASAPGGTLAWPWLYSLSRGDDERWFRGTRLRAVNLETGATWTYDKFVGSSSDILVRGDLVYARSDTGVLHAIDRATGRRRWAADIGDGTPAYPLDDGKVLVDDGERVRLLDPARPLDAARTVTVRGRYTDETGHGRAKVRVWVGDRPVLTGRGGHFALEVSARDTISVRVDPRDVEATTTSALLHPKPGARPYAELESYYEDCH